MVICSPHVGIAPESSSGGEVYEREILRHLATLGAHIELILPGGAPCWTDIVNWRVHRTRLRSGFRWYVANLVFPPHIGRVYRAQPFHVLRAHSLRFVGPATLWARRLYHLPVPIVAHHHHLDQSWLNPVIERRVIMGCDLVVTVSEFSRQQLAEDLGVDVGHVSVVYNGISRELHPMPRDAALARRLGLEGRRVVLFLGGLKPRKNLPMLLDAFGLVAFEWNDDVRLVIAGTGTEERALRRRTEALGIGDKVVFTGYVREADKARFYSLADVFALPSSLEGFGLTAGEAMSCGKPVVASRVGSLPEVVTDGETGFLVPLGDHQGFASRITALLRDGALSRQMGEAGRRRVESSFRWESAAQQTLDLYKHLVHEFRSLDGPTQ